MWVLWGSSDENMGFPAARGFCGFQRRQCGFSGSVGAVSVAKVATYYHQWLQLNNIEMITGRFEDKLPGMLQSIDCIDFAFIDGNHRLEPTKNYFQQLLLKSTTHSIFIFDDIHWSSEMEEAWNFIQQHPSVTATIDLFFFGIVLFRPEFKSKQHFIIRF